ncbi:MAG TPA: SMP-30/gluconolactonase/LRE family protein [Usitatibacter sp.]|nr:SMP-30/gluconolactonase/LRE family protein [Usitatibacter sp.]
MRFVLLALLLAAALPAATQDTDANARVRASINEALARRPDDATLHFFLARVDAMSGNAAAATQDLEKTGKLGDGFLPAKQLGFEKVWDDPAFQAERARMEAKLPRLDYAPTAVELQDRGLLPEGMAYDAPSESFFVGSIARRKIVRVSRDGAVSDFTVEGAGLDNVLGLAVDAPRRILYAVSTSALTAEGRKNRRNAIFAFDVDSGRLLHRMEIAGAIGLNDVAVAPGGRIFTTDSGSGAVYEVAPDKVPKAWAAPGELPGANGLAVSPDASRLYIAHNTGIAVVDIAKGGVKRVANATRENVSAIDGLYQWRGQLVGVQNVTTPGRVILITLSSDGGTITTVKTLLSHHHSALDEPTTGAATDRGFFLLAATGTAHYTDQGTIADPDGVPKPTIVRVLLPR